MADERSDRRNVKQNIIGIGGVVCNIPICLSIFRGGHRKKDPEVGWGVK